VAKPSVSFITTRHCSTDTDLKGGISKGEADYPLDNPLHKASPSDTKPHQRYSDTTAAIRRPDKAV
jgi:hypothetical protein